MKTNCFLSNILLCLNREKSITLNQSDVNRNEIRYSQNKKREKTFTSLSTVLTTIRTLVSRIHNETSGLILLAFLSRFSLLEVLGQATRSFYQSVRPLGFWFWSWCPGPRPQRHAVRTPADWFWDSKNTIRPRCRFLSRYSDKPTPPCLAESYETRFAKIPFWIFQDIEAVRLCKNYSYLTKAYVILRLLKWAQCFLISIVKRLGKITDVDQGDEASTV